MSAKKQSAITSFFTRTPKREVKEENEDAENLKTEKVKKESKNVLKRVNSQTIRDEEDESPMKTPTRATKKARIVVSSSSEDEDDSDDENFEVKEEDMQEGESDSGSEGSEDEGEEEESGEESEEKTPTPKKGKTRKSGNRNEVDTPKSVKKNKGESIEVTISMQSIENKMNTIVNESGERKNRLDKIASMKNNEEEEERERFDHENFDLIKPEFIRDAQKRRPTDEEYDPKTLFVPPEFLAKQTPGHKQWWMIKSQHYDTIILFKVGKFYETYHMDAVEVVRTLNIAFMRGSYAHAGFPEHAAAKFADQLMSHGYKVARVEQTETPQQLEERNTKQKGKDKVVRREVCRVTSNGTRTYGILDGVELGDAKDAIDPTAKYLLAIKESHNSETGKSSYGICMIDTTTAKIQVGQFDDDDYRSQLRTLLANIVVVQVLVEKNGLSASTRAILNGILCSVPVEHLISRKQFLSAEEAVKIVSGEDYYGSECPNWPNVFHEMMDSSSVLPRASNQFNLLFSAFGAILWYLRDSLIDVDMISMKNVERYDSNAIKQKNVEIQEDGSVDWRGKSLILDGTALENLNIVPNGRDSQSTCLYYVINKCQTPFGRRLLRSWLLQPICDPEQLKLRQDAVKWMTSPDASSFVTKAGSILKRIPDLDRLLQKIHTIGLKYRAEKHPDSRAVMFDTLKNNQRKISELLATIDGFKMCNQLREEYTEMQQQGEGCELLDDILGNQKQREEVEKNIDYFDKMFNREQAQKSGKIVPNEGCDETYDEAAQKVKNIEKELEIYRVTVAKKYSCNIKYVSSGKLKWLLELPESVKVASSFDLKGRRKGFIRYLTNELESLTVELEEAQKEKARLGDDTTRRVFEQFGCKNEVWAETVDAISKFDVLVSLVLFSKTAPFDMCMPEFDFDSKEPFINVEKGVHPCLALQANNDVTGTTSYIANTTVMGTDEKAAVMLLTGPNMGGKSTLMRQTAVLCILAHIGSMVPATEMKLTPIDRIFTRIGANDRIMCGESTFFIELKETDVMLKNATKHSLLLLDELGRGTSTFDGTAIASAVLQTIADELLARTFFSTHYHSICNAFLNHPNVRLAHMKCVVDRENNEDPTMEDVTFLYELESGVCPKSYGFYAAKLAGIDHEIVRNAFAESNKFASNLSIDPKLRKLVDAAKDDNCGIEELKRMIEAL